MSTLPEELVAEAARAQLWRDQHSRRLSFQSALWWGRLAGNPAARTALAARWVSLVEYLAERDQPIDLQDDPTFDPLSISDSVNVGRRNE